VTTLRLARRAAVAVGVVAVFYALVAAGFYLNQRRMLFPADPRPVPLADAGLKGFTRVSIATPDGERLVGWWRPPPPGQGAVLYFHGNAGGLQGRASRLQPIADAGMGALLVAYRGYSGSTGRPSERALLADAETVLDWLGERTRAERTAVLGESLGTGVAVALAAEREVGGVVLDSPYASITRLGQRLLPWLPVSLLASDRFDSESRIGRVREPILIVHCDGDRVIPISEGRRLFARANPPRAFLTVQGCGHTRAWYDAPAARARMLAALKASTRGEAIEPGVNGPR
jgi:fermentation-respiration switch protein FrsA (DUF1100 family)